jgi:hypothetical protein
VGLPGPSGVRRSLKRTAAAMGRPQGGKGGKGGGGSRGGEGGKGASTASASKRCRSTEIRQP